MFDGKTSSVRIQSLSASGTGSVRADQDPEHWQSPLVSGKPVAAGCLGRLCVALALPVSLFVCVALALPVSLFASVVIRGREGDHWHSQCHTCSIAELSRIFRTLMGKASGTDCGPLNKADGLSYLDRCGIIGNWTTFVDQVARFFSQLPQLLHETRQIQRPRAKNVR